MFNPWHDKRINLILRELAQIHHQLEHIRMNQAEAAAQLQTISTTLDKVATETTGLQAEIKTLQDAATNSDTVSPELQAAIDAVATRAAAIDALVPDATAPTPTEGA